ncbi:HD domain-containing protein [Halobacillus litoralis]|nr:HD domain-containing protein [Halobacillus litoralis]
MIEKARNFAIKAHSGQKRKSSDEDYVHHPIRVADQLQEAGFAEAVVCAGYLHDVVEDTDVTMEEIEASFGEEVAEIVAAHTEDKQKTWQERKQHTIDVVLEAPLPVKALIVADKLDNLRSIKEGLDKHGQELWNDFNAGHEKQKWYYQSIAEVMDKNTTTTPPFFETYRTLVYQTF